MNEQDFIYDDEAAVAFIQNQLPENLRKKISEDDTYYLLDTICDFYDTNDYLNEDDEEKEERELVKYLIAQAIKDEVGDYTTEEMLLFLNAEAAYSDTLDLED